LDNAQLTDFPAVKRIENQLTASSWWFTLFVTRCRTSRWCSATVEH